MQRVWAGIQWKKNTKTKINETKRNENSDTPRAKLLLKVLPLLKTYLI